MICEQVNIDKETGNADDYFCTEGGDIDTGMVIYGWDEIIEIESYFRNPVWFKVISE